MADTEWVDGLVAAAKAQTAAKRKAAGARISRASELAAEVESLRRIVKAQVAERHVGLALAWEEGWVIGRHATDPEAARNPYTNLGTGSIAAASNPVSGADSAATRGESQ